MAAVKDFSTFYLCHFNDCIKIKDLPNERLKELWSCNWTADKIQHILQQHLESSEISHQDDETLLLNAIQLLLVFIQNNFTGPFSQLEEFQRCINQIYPKDYEAAHQLISNGEEINTNVKLPELLVTAKNIIYKLSEKYPSSLIVLWWKHRLICIHQKIIDELTSSLYEELKSLSEFLLKNINIFDNIEEESLLYLEVANGYLLFHRTKKSEEILEDLCQRLKVVLNIEGLLGVRTKFQQKPLPQLCLKVNQTDASQLSSSLETNGRTNIPKLLKLDDDTRLEKIRFMAVEDNEVMSLPSVLQALVLAKLKEVKRSQPKDRLADEELEPYIATLLYQDHGPLQIRQSSLLLNAAQESNAGRTVERSWKQCEEAVKLLNDTKFTFPERISYAFASFLVPKWEVQMQLCEVMVSLGMTKSALDTYLQIQAWQKVIDCYNRLELRHKAAEIIRQELEKKPTVLLYCLLGDATDDEKCYETAWNFSKHTSGRAQAHWGIYYFNRKEYANAIPHFEKSVELNSLQEKIWLRLGYSAIMLENWKLAVHAYITYTHLEPLGFESWNNLAKALIKLGDKKRAHRVLGESLKCNYNNWKVWENFMVVSLDTGHFEDVINAYNRLSELKDRYIDLEVLTILINAIESNKPDAEGRPSKRLLKKATTFLGHQCVKHSFEAKLWELSALIATSALSKAQKLQKAYNLMSRKDTAWPTVPSSALKMLQICREICSQSLEAINNHDGSENSSVISQLSSSRLTAQGCVRAVEKNMNLWDNKQDILSELETVQNLVEKLQEAMTKQT